MTTAGARTAAAAPPAEPPQRVASAFRPVEEAFSKFARRTPGGGALVVMRDGQKVVDLVGGTADRGGHRPWTRETLGLSFSTTKGVTSTILHRLADRGMLDYDEPVATYWPEFAAGGKGRVTVRDLMTHRAGLHSVRAVARVAEDVLDHVAMEERLAARAVTAPTQRSAYHAITYGWLAAGLARRITGKGMAELAQVEIADPLGLDGLHIGMPTTGGEAMAEPIGSSLRRAGAAARWFSPLWTRVPATRTTLEALLIPGFHRLFEGADAPIWTTEMPAVNGAFSAEALARMYGALANGGVVCGHRLLSEDRVRELGRVHVRTTDAVLGIRMRWRLGYHHAFAAGRRTPMAFGHYGFGGSGGWADPASGLSLGFVTNKLGSVSTPMGDFALLRLSGVVRECARRADAASAPV